MPEYLLGIIATALLGWGGFTWKKAEDALTEARSASDKIDQVELKMAENYLTKQEFESYMSRLFDTLKEMKGGLHYLTERVDYHVKEQAGESRQLKKEIEYLRHNPRNRRIDD